MNQKYSIFFLLSFLLIAILSMVSCSKENIDINDPGNPIIVDTLYCDIVAEIIEDFDSTGTVLSVNVENGVLPFSYLWSDSTTAPTLPILVDGAYQVTVTDSFNCSSVADFDNTIDFCDDFTLQIVAEPDSMGMVNLIAEVSGGTSPYLYNWYDGSMFSMVIIEVQPGVYGVTVTDSYGCVLDREHQQ